ncbi:MAG TPA: lysophospholipid acyltransferase family protein [Candidatus Binatia bacterium]|nr:lysophospholipid acyltransferase family protein [Candidatus Binatia bacterium]
MARRKVRTAMGHFFYGVRYRTGEYALRGLVRLLPWIPYRLLALFIYFWAWVTFRLLWKYRTRMEENVATGLGDKIISPGERKALVWQAWKNFAHGVLDTCAVMHLSKEAIVSNVAIKGEEHLKQALAKGKGVLGLSAHLGAFTMIGPRIAAEGYPFSAVVKQPKDEHFARYIDDLRAQKGIRTISAKPRKEAVRGILKSLRENRIVLVIADEFKSGDVTVDFMGQQFPAPRGPATLALRTGAVTLPMFMTWRPDGSLCLLIEPEISPVRLDNLEDSVAATTALFTRHLESTIRRYPEQWNWLGFPRNGRIPRSKNDAATIQTSNTELAPERIADH